MSALFWKDLHFISQIVLDYELQRGVQDVISSLRKAALQHLLNASVALR